jgi:curved DNA-binding protein CbpA
LKDYYAILGIQREASSREVKRAYRKLVRKCHPDLHPGDPTCKAKIQEINEAYEVLSDPVKRRAYDRRVEVGKISQDEGLRSYPTPPEHPFLAYFFRVHEAQRKKRAGS